MLKDGQPVLGEFDLPVCMEQLPASYSMLSPEVCTHKKSVTDVRDVRAVPMGSLS